MSGEKNLKNKQKYYLELRISKTINFIFLYYRKRK